MRELVFLKLGGSLITDKTQRYAVRLDKLAELTREIKSALAAAPDLRLVLGHGSGSFGHYAVTDHMSGLTSPFADAADAGAYWQGYSEVRYRAAQLNQYVMDALHAAGIPAIALQPSALVKAVNGAVASWDLSSLQAALDSSLVPVIYGDIVFDSVRGSVVLSTEALMIHLVPTLRPRRILLAGIEAAVWADYPTRDKPIASITPSSYATLVGKVGGSHGPDVTGGMKAKVEEMLALVKQTPGLTVQIFSGEQPGNVAGALAGGNPGTVLLGD